MPASPPCVIIIIGNEKSRGFMRKIKIFIALLIVSILFGLTTCDTSGGSDDDHSDKTLTVEEVMEILAVKIYYTLHNADSAIDRGAYGKTDDFDSGVPAKEVTGYKSGTAQAVGAKTRKYVSTGTYTEKTVDDSIFYFYFDNYAYDDDLKLNSDYYWSMYQYHYETQSSSTEVLPESTEYYVFDCEYVLKYNAKTYTGKIDQMQYKTYLYSYYDDYLRRMVHSQDRYFNAYIKLTDGREFDINGTNW